MATTSKAIRELLERKGVVPTGDKDKDMALAKSVMPKPFKRVSNESNQSKKNYID